MLYEWEFYSYIIQQSVYSVEQSYETSYIYFVARQLIKRAVLVVQVKNLPAKAKDAGSIPWSGKENGDQLQYSCLIA